MAGSAQTHKTLKRQTVTGRSRRHRAAAVAGMPRGVEDGVFSPKKAPFRTNTSISMISGETLGDMNLIILDDCFAIWARHFVIG